MCPVTKTALPIPPTILEVLLLSPHVSSPPCIRPFCPLESRSPSSSPRDCSKSPKRNQRSLDRSVLSPGHVPSYFPCLSHPALQLHFRWRSRRLDQESLREPAPPSHSFFGLGVQTAPPSYIFGAIFGCYKVRNITFPANAIQTFSQVFLQSGLDQDGNVSGRFKYRWTPSTATKLEARVRFTQRALGCTHITPRSCHKAATI